MLQEFNLETRDEKGVENLAVDHFSRLENPHQGQSKEEDINDAFLKEHLYNLEEVIKPKIPWFAEMANYLTANILRKGLFYQQKNILFERLSLGKSIFVSDLCKPSYQKIYSTVKGKKGVGAFSYNTNQRTLSLQ